MIVLLGIAVVVAGFATRRNPLLVVGVSGVVTGLLGKMSPLRVLDAFGTGFASSRTVTLFVLVLPMIGLLEYHGLREQARALIGRLRRLGAGPLLAAYMVIRQVAIAFGVNLGGPAQIVRPILAPMAEAAVERKHGVLPDAVRERVRAGFCGTLVTPMAANFNLVPATLLELKDQYGPIKAQVPTAGALLVCNIAIMAVWGF